MLAMRLDGFTYQQIADKFNVSRQRIQQILSPPKAIRNYVVEKFKGRCADCGINVGKSGHIHHENSDFEDYNDINNLELLCISCHGKRHRETQKEYCLQCGKELTLDQIFSGGKYCSMACRSDSLSVEVRCAECGEIIKIRKKYKEFREKHPQSGNGKPQKHWFCSKRCLGKWSGKNYGSKGRIGYRKHIKMLPVIRDLLNQGYSMNRVLINIGIPTGSSGVIKKYLTET